MTTFETVQAYARELAELFAERRYPPNAKLPLLEITNEHHVPIYNVISKACDVWSVGTWPTVNRGEKTQSPVYITADGTIVYLYPLSITVSTGYEKSGWPAQRVDVLVLREMTDRQLSDAQVEDLHNLLYSV
jgi:hypothetical protein